MWEKIRNASAPDQKTDLYMQNLHPGLDSLDMYKLTQCIKAHFKTPLICIRSRIKMVLSQTKMLKYVIFSILHAANSYLA